MKVTCGHVMSRTEQDTENLSWGVGIVDTVISQRNTTLIQAALFQCLSVSHVSFC